MLYLTSVTSVQQSKCFWCHDTLLISRVQQFQMPAKISMVLVLALRFYATHNFQQTPCSHFVPFYWINILIHSQILVTLTFWLVLRQIAIYFLNSNLIQSMDFFWRFSRDWWKDGLCSIQPMQIIVVSARVSSEYLGLDH